MLCLLCWLICQWMQQCALAQTIQFTPPPLNAPLTSGSPFGSAPTISPPALNVPGAQLSPPSFGAGSFPSATTPSFGTPTFGTPGLGTQGFTNPAFTPRAPTSTPWFGSPNTSGALSPAPMFGNATPWNGGSPASLFPNSGSVNPFSAPPTNAYGVPPANGFGNSSPGTLFPNGLWGPNAANGANNYGVAEPFRFLQHPQVTETYLYRANHTDDLQIHDMKAAITGVIPNFAIAMQPLKITPTFVLHLWDGPQGIAADLPANAYSAYLDTFWASDPDRPLGVELGASVGVYTDFDTINKHSLRVLGEGFGVARLTPTLTLKLGAWYLDRNDLKLLPAGGLVWQPNPQTKFDILFPNPKFSQYLTTLGSSSLTWYIAGEYGGGAWTIQRANGSGDRIDINDIRVKLGIDWINDRNWRGFAEIGYVFDRHVIYVVNPGDNFNPRNTIMAAAGFSF